MTTPTRDEVLGDIVHIVMELSQDWDVPGPLTRETRLLADLKFESIDVVALGSAIEERYARSLPFAQWLQGLQARETRDMCLGELVDFVHGCLAGTGTQP